MLPRYEWSNNSSQLSVYTYVSNDGRYMAHLDGIRSVQRGAFQSVKVYLCVRKDVKNWVTIKRVLMETGFNDDHLLVVFVKEYITTPAGSTEFNDIDRETLTSLIDQNRTPGQLDIIVGKRHDVERIVETLNDHDNMMDWVPHAEPKGKEPAPFIDYYDHEDDVDYYY